MSSPNNAPSATTQSTEDNKDAALPAAQVSTQSTEEQFWDTTIPGKNVNIKDFLSRLSSNGGVDGQPAAISPDMLALRSGLDLLKNPNDMQDSQARYQEVMRWLTSVDDSGKTKMELYTTYQAAYMEVVAEKERAYKDALEDIRSSPQNSPDDQERLYEQW